MARHDIGGPFAARAAHRRLSGMRLNARGMAGGHLRASAGDA
jgi:hypothetical protein